jgi:hypothetical protein
MKHILSKIQFLNETIDKIDPYGEELWWDDNEYYNFIKNLGFGFIKVEDNLSSKGYITYLKIKEPNEYMAIGYTITELTTDMIVISHTKFFEEFFQNLISDDNPIDDQGHDFSRFMYYGHFIPYIGEIKFPDFEFKNELLTNELWQIISKIDNYENLIKKIIYRYNNN